LWHFARSHCHVCRLEPGTTRWTEGSAECDVVDFGVGTPVGAAGDGDFEFAGEIVEIGIAAEFAINGERERRNVGEFVGVDAGERAAGDVTRDVAASAGGGEADGPEALEKFGEMIHGDPVELDVLADGDVGDAVAKIIGEVGDRARLLAGEETVGNADADHEKGDGLPFPILSAGNPRAVPLRVNPPSAEVGAEPFGGDGVEAIAGKGADFLEAVPGVFGAFESLDALSFGFLDFGHWSDSLSTFGVQAGMPVPQNRDKKKPTDQKFWHVGFETWTSGRAKFDSTSGQNGAADSNSRRPRDNNRSGNKRYAYSIRGYVGYGTKSILLAMQTFDADHGGFGYMGRESGVDRSQGHTDGLRRWFGVVRYQRKGKKRAGQARPPQRCWAARMSPPGMPALAVADLKLGHSIRRGKPRAVHGLSSARGSVGI